LSLLPLLVLLMGLYKKISKPIYLFFVAAFCGVLIQFHYQFSLIILGLILYYFVVKKLGVVNFLVFVLGLITGFLPILIFEVRNNFYNLQTFWLFVTHGVFSTSREGWPPHYFLSILFFVFLLVGGLMRKMISTKEVVAAGSFLLIISMYLYARNPSHSFGMIEGWNYQQEEKASAIIASQNLHGFNIANPSYDTKAWVQKYLLESKGIFIDKDNYTNNEYLFVIVENGADFTKNPAYEISTFKPSHVLDVWKINDGFTMYLLKRDVARSK
jgi:hypothetical protein